VSDDSISLASLAARGVVDGVGHILVYGERLSSHGRLINSKDGMTDMGDSFVIVGALLEFVSAW
jgi:hypothetical protein